jgi:hypothetical protein
VKALSSADEEKPSARRTACCKRREAESGGSAIVGHMLAPTESRADRWQILSEVFHATCNSARLEFLQCAIKPVVHMPREMR